jgi:hypothetical protein
MTPVKELLDAADHSYLALDSIRAQVDGVNVVVHSLDCPAGLAAEVSGAMAPGTAALLARRLGYRLRGCADCHGVRISSRAA